ncbi:MAG TPA: hypothetical protein VFV33_25980, partial [Gemmatimonadaceae bacterium]|nr:hypothetical protein [Gemmatimonadaceae bacterium]
SPCFAWINREAVRVTGIAGNVLTVTRGRLGTKAVAHTVDATRALFPEAFTSVPWTTRRKVCLWRVDGTAATLAWVGVAQRAPALGDDGATFTLQCDPLWTVLKSAPVGGELPRTSLVGWSSNGAPSLGQNSLLHTRWMFGGTDTVSASTHGVFRTREAALRHHEAAIATATDTVGTPLRVVLAASGQGITLSCEDTYTMHVWVYAPTLRGVTPTSSFERTAGRHQLRVPVSPIPPSMHCFYDTPDGTRCVSTVAGLASSWSSTATTEASVTTWEQPALRVAASADWYAIMIPSSLATSGELGPRIVDAVGSWIPRRPAAQPPAFPVVLTAPEPVQQVMRVRTEHWAFGLKHSVIALCEDGDTRDWDLTTVATVARATSGLRVARDWTFDGRRTLGALLTECSLLHGCSLVTRSGLLALHAWGWPSAGATAALTIAASDIVGKPTWSRWADAPANRV